MIVAGIGFASSATTEEIVDIVREALARTQTRAARLATVETRAALPAFAEAAARLGLPMEAVPPEILRTASGGVVSCSTRAQAAHDVGSVAEAAALAAAGEGATLVLARITGARVTCALARSAVHAEEAPR
ncbi:cobalamin biosynthesis protein [Salinarimonas ramus]|uniref:Precorrin methylase n=1 Tax=Salinarimonas ramus TaxID=690164 RepID=A0A917QKT5_9HYPH|nr:cobalamin biosynthesis protein [Salinarimonas ramus]GGK55401.1 precorrin methylase [Salinarimonas ramus]